TSAASGTISAPVALRMSPMACSSTSLRRAQATTRAPDLANRSTAALPSPSLPPVTIATLPLRPSSSVSMAGEDTLLLLVAAGVRRPFPRVRPGLRGLGGIGRRRLRVAAGLLPVAGRRCLGRLPAAELRLG